MIAGENKMNEVREALIEKIKYLPDNKLSELINLIDVLTVKKTQGILLSLSGMPVSSEETDQELYGDIKQ